MNTQTPETDHRFPRARLTDTGVLHYIDDYRYPPGHPELKPVTIPRTLCGRDFTGISEVRDNDTGYLCARCTNKADTYPTAAEFRAYWSCTDCGVDTWALGEVHYQVLPSVWELAYPGYNTHHIGLGTSRPCIGCLETRIGRQLTAEDFRQGHFDSPDEEAAFAAGCSDRLNHRRTTPAGDMNHTAGR